MRLFQILFSALLSVLLLSGCEKKLESRILGKWDYSEKGHHIVNSIFTSDTNLVLFGAVINFKENSTGVLTIDTLKKSFDYSASDEEITLSFEEEDPITYTVILNTNDQQIWVYKKDNNSEEGGISYSEKWRTTISLKKLN